MKKFLFTALPLAAIFGAAFFLMQPAAQAEQEHEGHAQHEHNHGAAAETPAIAADMAAGHAENAPASEKPVMAYTCDAPEFTLTQTGDSYVLNARIETPTPGFEYALEQTEDKNGRIKATLEINAPDGMIIQVIDAINISHTFEHAGMLHMLSIHVDKDFNWGPNTINCKHD